MKSETIYFLRRYNQWRQGDETIDQPNPREIGKHLEAAIDYLRGQQCDNCANLRHVQTMLEETAELAAVLKKERDEARKESEYYRERYEQLKDERDVTK